MSCARRANCPGLNRGPCSKFNPLIPPHHVCLDILKERKEQYEREKKEQEREMRGEEREIRGEEKEKRGEESKELVCTWSRSPTECVQFDCFGEYDMKKYRPKCEDVVTRQEKFRPEWCNPHYRDLISRCNAENPCPSRFYCKESEPDRDVEYPDPQPWRTVPCCCPKFLWSHGYATLNINNVRYPEQMEGLKFKEKVKEDLDKVKTGDEKKNKGHTETELWSLTCMPSDARPPLWKTLGERPPWCSRPAAPLYFWKDGRPRPNDLRLPYPGHGFQLFDPCQHRRSFPSQAFIPEMKGVFAPPKAICGNNCY